MFFLSAFLCHDTHFVCAALCSGVSLFLCNSPVAQQQPPQPGRLIVPSVPSSPGPRCSGWRSVPSPASCVCEAGTACCSPPPFSAFWWDNYAGGSAGQSWTCRGSNPYHCFLYMKTEKDGLTVRTHILVWWLCPKPLKKIKNKSKSRDCSEKSWLS